MRFGVNCGKGWGCLSNCKVSALSYPSPAICLHLAPRAQVLCLEAVYFPEMIEHDDFMNLGVSRYPTSLITLPAGHASIFVPPYTEILKAGTL